MASVSKKDEEVYLDIFCEFLEVLIHQILYLRDLYPASIFQQRRKFNMPLRLHGNILCDQNSVKNLVPLNTLSQDVCAALGE